MNPLLQCLRWVCVVVVLASLAPARADNIDDRIVDVNATVSSTVPRITLNWTHRLSTTTTGYSVFRWLKGDEGWTKLADLAKTETTYADATADAQVHYEYKVERKHSTTTPPIAYGLVCSGVDIPAVHHRGKLILLVDNSMTTPLATEIAQLEQDLTGDGWTVLRHDLPRMTTNPATTGTAVGPARLAEIEATKAVILSDYNADPTKVTAVYLLGRLPVPYSGNVNPDGHTNHRGAWPADVYYGDMNGTTWTDSTVDNSATTHFDVRNRNIPGDGKFDQSNTFGATLQVGRVDLSNMTLFPNTGTSETELLRRYLNRAHAFRHRQGDFETISRQAFIDYNFGYNYVTSWYLGFAWQGWMTGYSWFGRGNLVQGSWFLTSSTYNTVNQSYLFGYADGGGGFQSIADVGTSTDFGTTPSKVVFNALFGSYFGDWDRSNCILRAPLAATTSSHGLVSFWPGSVGTANSYDPLTGTFVKNMTSWMLHPMAMGETIGYCARIAQAFTVYNQWTPHGTNGSIHAALMGDPSLRAFVPKPVTALTATDNAGNVILHWSAPAESTLLGYHVYRAPDADGPFSRLNAALVTAPSHTDTTIPSSGTWHYMVRPVIRETTASGSYENPVVS